MAMALSIAVLAGSIIPSVRAGEPISPITAPDNLDPERVALGDRLFHDPRLSSDNSVSCASCHVLALGGADGHPVSIGVGGARGEVNSPTVYNTGLNLAQFWDGRARTLEEQVDGPLHRDFEMASDWSQVLDKLRHDDELVAEFDRAYEGGLSPTAVRDAIAEFERSLVTPDSPFDRWLKGDDDALGPEAREGYRLFKDYGCAACHQGANVGGNMFHRLGAMAETYFDERGDLTEADLGRFNVTGDDEDRYVFKVPSLRLVTLTPPYFHDGSQETLEEAIDSMARYQLARQIDERDVDRIIRFLESLVGKHPRLDRRGGGS